LSIFNPYILAKICCGFIKTATIKNPSTAAWIKLLTKAQNAKKTFGAVLRMDLNSCVNHGVAVHIIIAKGNTAYG